MIDADTLKAVSDERLKRIKPDVWKRAHDLDLLGEAYRIATNVAKRLVRAFLGRHGIRIEGTDFYVDQKVRPALYVDQKVAPVTAGAKQLMQQAQPSAASQG